MESSKLSPTALAFVALTNEYCHLVENAMDYGRDSLIESILKLLPRIYITATDIEPSIDIYDTVINQVLDEDGYNIVRDNIASIMGEEDVYLEVFVEDMKYSDTPIATSISENLADLYQEFYNLVASIKDLMTDDQQELIGTCRENFVEYWGQTLCNVMRALHSLLKKNDYYEQY